nr:MAG TPA: hypothetical protein [Caudoviricetes sp.]
MSWIQLISHPVHHLFHYFCLQKHRLLPDTEIVPSWRRFPQQNKNFEALNENLKDAAKKIVVLWTNPEWNSSTNLTPFVAQEIQIDNISDFDMIGICHSCYNNTCNYFNFFLNIFNKEINLIETFSNIKSTEYYVRLYYRKFIITQSGIKFDIGYSNSHTQVAANNSYAIPVKIIGIKF